MKKRAKESEAEERFRLESGQNSRLEESGEKQQKKLKRKRFGAMLLLRNLWALVGFEVSFKALSALIIAPLLSYIFNTSIRVAGYGYLSNDNLFVYLEKPSTLIILAILIIILMLFVLFEMFALTGCYHASYDKRKVRSVEMYRIGLSNLKRALYPVNWSSVIWVFFLLPGINLLYLLGLIRVIKLPGFVTSYLSQHKLFLIIAAVVVILVCLLSILRLYCLQGFIVEKTNIFKGQRLSRKMMKGHYFKTAGNLLLWNALIVVGSLLFFWAAVRVTVEVSKLLGIYKTLHIVTLQSTSFFTYAMVIGYFLFFIPLNIAFISSSYFRKKDMAGEPVPSYITPEALTKNPKRMRILTSVFVAALLLNSVTAFAFRSESLTLNAELFNVPIVMAHRGDSSEAPENTMAAFESAIDNMADYIELDVQMTKDGVVVVSHDSNLRRVTGVNKNIWQVTYDEIKDLDAGSFFDPQFAGETIPTLEEVVQLTKGKIRLNIEMKPTGHEIGFEAEVARIIEEYGIEDSCMVCSMKYKTLENIKKINPNIETTYVVIMAYSNFWQVDAADAFSVSYSMLDKTLVNNIKSAGKDIYVWTVNSDKQMLAAIDMGVDGLITDYPVLAKEMVLSRYTPDDVIDLIDETDLELENVMTPDSVLEGEEAPVKPDPYGDGSNPDADVPDEYTEEEINESEEEIEDILQEINQSEGEEI